MNTSWLDFVLNHPKLHSPDKFSTVILNGLSELEKLEHISPDELKNRQTAQFANLLKHVAVESDLFHNRLSSNITDIETLPILTRQDIIKGNIFCKNVPKSHGGVSTLCTSGSTGEPVTVMTTDKCQLQWMLNTMREHLWHRRTFGRLAICRANIASHAIYPNWGPPCSLLLDTDVASVFPATKSVEEITKWLIDFNPTNLLILPKILAEVRQALINHKHQLKISNIRTVGENVTQQLRDDIFTTFNIKIDDIYSSQEVGIIATQCEFGSYHISENIILEVVDQSNKPCTVGEVGRVLITDLNNYATPIIRYEIGDYAEVGGKCKCGRCTPTLNKILGRDRNLVKLPNGTRHYPIVGFHSWDEGLGIKQFQFIQSDINTIQASLVVDVIPSSEKIIELTKTIQESLKHPFDIKYNWVYNPIPRSVSGKFDEFRCDVHDSSN